MPDEHKTLEQRIADIEIQFEEASRGDHRRVHFLGRKDCP